MVPLELVHTIVNDFKSKHKAEQEALKSEMTVFKKVIHLMSVKIRDLRVRVVSQTK